jgi:hypothetical protein
MNTNRNLFYPRLSYRWFATRGWAYGAALALGSASLWLRPVDLPFDNVFIIVPFANAAIAMLLLGTFPEHLHLRLYAIAASVFATLIRAWGIMTGLDNGTSDMSRVSASIIWLFVGYACWLLATFTSKIPMRKYTGKIRWYW